MTIRPARATQTTAASLPLFALAYAGSAAVQKGLGFLLLLWMAREMPVEAYATFGLLFALQSGLATLAGAGIGDAVVGRLKDHHTPEAQSGLFSSANTLFACLSGGAAVVAVIVFALFLSGSHGSPWVLAAALVGGVLTAFFTLQSMLVRLQERHGASLALGFVAPMAGLIGAGVGFASLRSVDGFFGGMAAGLLAALFAGAASGIGHYRFAARDADTSAIGAAVTPYLLIALLAWLGGYGSTYIVKSFFATRDVAMFTFAYTLSSILQLVATSTNQVWSPRFFRIAHELPVAELEHRNLRFFTLQGSILGVTGGLFLMALPLFTDAIGGNLLAYRGLTTELCILFAGYAVAIPWWHTQNYYLVHNRGAELMKVVVATSLLGLVAWTVAMWVLGVIGVYLGFMLNMLIRSLGALAWGRRYWALRLAWRGPVIALALLIAAEWISRTHIAPVA
jgi:O-antigen/teichoic acid export membrane protein